MDGEATRGMMLSREDYIKAKMQMLQYFDEQLYENSKKLPKEYYMRIYNPSENGRAIEVDEELRGNKRTPEEKRPDKFEPQYWLHRWLQTPEE